MQAGSLIESNRIWIIHISFISVRIHQNTPFQVLKKDFKNNLEIQRFIEI